MAFEGFDPGTLDKKISIYLPGAAIPDDDGFETVGTETLVRTCWARITYQSGKELRESGSEFGDATQRFLVRHSSAEINTDMFVRYAGKDYDIQYVNTYGDSGEYDEIWTGRKARV